MARYIRKFPRIGLSLGPSEERGFAMWVGYDIADFDEDLSAHGYVRVEGWPEARLAEYNVATFKRVTAADLGIGRDRP
jgi:hypothetical protein